ncbi:Uracil-DNA glycosylase [Candidatus Izimaplasma bacterium HR1]|jgi:uracil-DNA glycosylase|uniref:uracil-DNA glycosylase n=1 Tax=Candidatus Izimoplasma sp. HR1 TaxID=1541959 RepID=UPI0004F737BA|nr:Uracil-DNA glycosylase [Candidatus Izimaplasma bacterium HR1]
MWHDYIEKEKQKDYFKKLEDFTEKEYETKEIFPPYKDIFNAFNYCPFVDTKVIILGQDPYHDFNQAHGLAFSVKKGNKIPPSLRNIYKELNSDLGLSVPEHGELTNWAKQGILLLNTILTVEAHKPMSHSKKGWETFTDNVIRELNKDSKPKVFVLWGNNARKKNILIDNPKHLIIETSHPSPLSARHSFFGSKVFTKINDFLFNNYRSIIDFELE